MRVAAVTKLWMLPRGADSQTAEAWGARMGMDMLREIGVGGGGARHAAIVGDSLPVIRYCSDVGRLRRPHLHTILDEPLSLLACSGREVRWIAVRRRFNAGADKAATGACLRAAQAAELGQMEPFGVTEGA